MQFYPKTTELFSASSINIIAFQGDNMRITEITRRNLIDEIKLGIAWSGRLTEIDFLSRLYDLENLPSKDHRFKSMRGDIWPGLQATRCFCTSRMGRDIPLQGVKLFSNWHN